MSEPPRRSRFSMRRPSGALFWLASVLCFAGFVVPLIHANRFRLQIQRALENALGRRVEIGEVTLHLLTGPGFQLENVIIGEAPAYGAEHFAYMTSMQVRLRLRTLWTGRIQLASLTLVEPTLNLVKNAEGRWNVEALMERAAPPGAPAKGSAEQIYFPYIGIEDGRINFKFGDYKSVFHIREAEAAISPPRDTGGRWGIRFAGTPARTDRVLSGMRRVTGRGVLTTAGGSRSVQMNLELEDSPMAHLLTLTYGGDFGVHGELGAKLRLSGELSHVRVDGVLEIGDVHRWDLMPAAQGRLEAPFVGEWSLTGQSLRLETNPSAPFAKAVRVGFALENYLTGPRWTASVGFDHAPAGPLVRIARHFGAAIPAETELDTTVGGRLDFANSAWPSGNLEFQPGKISLPGSPPIEIGAAEVQIDGPAFQLSPTEVRMEKQVVEVAASGRLDNPQIETVIGARGVRLDAMRTHASLWQPGWLRSLSNGSWDGRVVYRKEGSRPGAWTGSGILSKTRWQPQGLESPVDIAEARVRWEPKALYLDSLSGALGETSFTGACSHGEVETICRIRIRELDLGRLDRWFHPQQKISRWAVWKRALSDTSSPGSHWWKSANVRGTVAIDRLRLGRWTFSNIRSDATWTVGTLTLGRIRTDLGKGPVTGALKAEFSGAVPRYSFQAVARNVDLATLAGPAMLPTNFRRGVVELRLGLTAAGRTAAELRAGLKLNGVFDARDVSLARVEWNDGAGESDGILEVRSLEGQFQWTRGGLELPEVRLTIGNDVFEGAGSLVGRSPVLLDTASGGKQLRLLGGVAELATTSGQ